VILNSPSFKTSSSAAIQPDQRQFQQQVRAYCSNKFTPRTSATEFSSQYLRGMLQRLTSPYPLIMQQEATTNEQIVSESSQQTTGATHSQQQVRSYCSKQFTPRTSATEGYISIFTLYVTMVRVTMPNEPLPTHHAAGGTNKRERY
jgi:hypothetical protein